MANFNWPSLTTQTAPIEFELDGNPTTVSEDTGTPANSVPLPVKNLDASGLPVDFATEAKQDTMISELQSANVALLSVETELQDINSELDAQTTQLNAIAGDLNTLSGVDFATETTLDAVKTAVESLDAFDFATETTLAALEAKDFATQTTLALIEGKDFATETTLAALDAKVTACDTDDVTVTALPVAYNSGTAGADTQRVVIATDQAPVATKSPVNTGGSVVNGTLTATTASAETVPADAVGFILQAPSDNTDNIRYRIGGTASTTAGMLMEPGRDTGFIPIAANLSICATASGTNKYELLWVIA